MYVYCLRIYYLLDKLHFVFQQTQQYVCYDICREQAKRVHQRFIPFFFFFLYV